jgi:hypothetical protein
MSRKSVGANMVTMWIFDVTSDKFNTSNSQRKSNKMQQCIKILYLQEAQHVSGDTPPIIRSPKLH